MPQFGGLFNSPTLTGTRSVTSPYSGNTYTYEWDKTTPPTDDDLDSIISAHENIPKQTANEQNIDTATKPEGKSHGAVADFAWNVGKRIADVPSQLLEMSPLGQSAKSAKTLDEISKKYPNDSEAQNKELEDIFSKSNPQLEQQTAAAIKSPWEMTKAAANALDPTGAVPGYMSLGEMGVKDITDKNWAGVTSDAALAVAPWAIGKGLGKLASRFAPVETPPEKYAGSGSTITDPKQLPAAPPPAAPRALLGPPREPLPGAPPQRFNVEPTGNTVDLQDPSTIDIFNRDVADAQRKQGRVVYPPRPPAVGDPTKANAIPPIDSLPKVDDSVIPPAARVAKVVPDVTPIPEQGLAATGPINTSLPKTDIVSKFNPPAESLEAGGPKPVGSGSTIPRKPGLFNRLFNDTSGEYEVGRTTNELQKMKEEFLRKQEENRNLPPVEPIGPDTNVGKVAPFAPTSREYQRKANEENVIMGGVRPERGVPVVHNQTLGGFEEHVRGNEYWITHPMLDKPQGPFKSSEAAFDWVLNKQETPEFQKYLEKSRELPEIDRPQSMSIPPPEREPIPDPSELQYPAGKDWAAQAIELDKANAPDTAYRDILSTGSKRGLSMGETWRDRVIDYIDRGEGLVRENKAGIKPVKGLPTISAKDQTLPPVKPVSIEPVRQLPAVEPIVQSEPIATGPKVETRGRKPLFPPGSVRIPRGESPSLTELPPVEAIDKPQEMKVREGGYSGTEDKPVGPVIINPQTGRPNIAMGGADPQVLRQLGTSLYTKDRPSVLIQELMQNTVDEMKIAKVQKPIRVAFAENTKNPVTGNNSKSITFQDFGRGMNENQLYNEFSDVGKSGKRNIQGAAGGFGFAKAAPFLGGDHMRTESVTIENGQKVKYTFSGKPEEFLNQEVGVPLNREIVPDSTPTGMRVEVFFPENKSFYSAKDLLQTITESSPDIKDVETISKHNEPDTADPKSTIDRFVKGGKANLDPYGSADTKTFQGKPLPSYKDTIRTPENNADIYYDLDNKERTGTKLIFLNNGVYYHVERQTASTHAMPHIPERIIIDVKSKVAEGHDKYPFPANRQGLNEEVKAGFRDWIDTNVIDPAKAIQKNELQNLYDNTKPKPGMDHVVLDSGEKYTPEELTRVEKSATLGKVAHIMGNLLTDLESHFDKDELLGTTDKHGFRVADPGSGGMNISDPSTRSPNLKTLVTINPFDALYTGLNKNYRYAPKELQPPEAARRFVHLIKHEFAHNLAREEGAGFTWAFSQVDTRFPRTTHYESQIFKALTDGSGDYAPEVSQLLQEYLESRERPGTKEDILARQGAGIENDGGGKSKGVSRSDKSDGEGVAPPVKPKVIKALREGVVSKEQIENELAGEGLPAVEPVKNWGGEPKTVTIEGKGKKLAGKKGLFDYRSEADIPDVPGAEPKTPLAERFGIKPTSEVKPGRERTASSEGLFSKDAPKPIEPVEETKAKPSFESGKGYIDPNKIDTVYQDREFIKGKANVDKIMEERAALKAGEAVPSFKDPSGFKANYASPHTTLLNNPLTEPLARPIVEAYDKKIQWTRAKLVDASPFIKGLNKADRMLLGKALDTGDLSGLTPELADKAKGLKKILDKIHSEFPENKNVGYIKNYFTHIAEEKPEGLIKSTLNLFKDKEVKNTGGLNGLGDYYEKGLGTPDSPYVKKRTGALENINYDVKDVLPKYLDSVAKVIFDQPAVEKAKLYLRNVPEGSNLRDLASWYIKNYTRYDSEAGLHEAFGSFVSKVANTTARSFIDWNLPLHSLHLGEIPVNIWPELGSKYTAHGIKEVTMNPGRTWNETARLGLIQGESKPFAFKTTAERYSSLAYFLNMTEKFVKGVGYEGYRKMYLDQGMSPVEASKKAVEATKNVTLDTGPARQIKGLSSESNTAGGEVSSRLGGQFKGIPIKIAEQIYNTAKNAKANPKAAARMLAGAAAMIYATKKGGHLFHLDPASLARTTALGAFGTAAADFTSALYRGDYETAMEDAMAWAIPGGQTGKKIYESVTNKPAREKALAAQREKEGKSQRPPVNTPKRVMDYMFKGG